MDKYEKLKKEYPDYVSLDQFHRICGIAKRSARYLIEHGILPVTDTGKKTWRYKIAIDDVIAYLQLRAQVGSMIPRGRVSSRADRLKKTHRKSYAELVPPGMEKQLRDYFEYIYAEYPDVLTLLDAAEMTGLEKSTLARAIRLGDLEGFLVARKYHVPKMCLIEYTASSKFIDCQSRSEGFRRIVGGFELWRNAKV